MDRFRKQPGWRLLLRVVDAEADSSIRGIALALNSRGVEGPGGTHWNKVTIRRMLTQPAYVGLATIGHARKSRTAFNRAEARQRKGIVPAIIPLPLWTEAQKKLERLADHRCRKQMDNVPPLLGILYCGHCGYALPGSFL